MGELCKKSHLCHYVNMTHQQSLQSKLKQPFTRLQYDRALDLNHSNISEDNKQTFNANRLFSGLRRHVSKLVVNCLNEKVGKSGKEINIILDHLLTISLFIKVKVTFLFYVDWVCKTRVTIPRSLLMFADVSYIFHWEPESKKVNFLIIDVLNWNLTTKIFV